MKIKCLRFECEACSKLANIQVFYNKNGEIKYCRARHYTGQVNGKPQSEYHQQSLGYIERKLSEIPEGKAEIDHAGQKNDDLQKAKSSSKLLKAGPMGFMVVLGHLYRSLRFNQPF